MKLRFFKILQQILITGSWSTRLDAIPKYLKLPAGFVLDVEYLRRRAGDIASGCTVTFDLISACKETSVEERRPNAVDSAGAVLQHRNMARRRGWMSPVSSGFVNRPQPSDAARCLRSTAPTPNRLTANQDKYFF